MKKTLSILLAACLIMVLAAGCGPKQVSYDLTQLSENLEGSGAFSDILSEVGLNVAATLYGFDAADVSECRLLCSTGATTEEIGLFNCKDEEAAKRVKTAAEARVDSQRTAYESYAPEEMPKLDDAIVKQEGTYVFYIVAKNADAASAVLK